jgi:hypothetical protein
MPIFSHRLEGEVVGIRSATVHNQYVSLPAIVYGNYFSTPSDHFLVYDLEAAKKVIKHVTNRGRYPFCYQKISEASSVAKCVSIFGKTINCWSRKIPGEKIEVFRLVGCYQDELPAILSGSGEVFTII